MYQQLVGLLVPGITTRTISLLILLVPFCPVYAQLNLHIEEHFFPGKNIVKVETTYDGYVWVLGEDNFIARISPADQVEDFTLLFASHSTYPFTDISSHMSDTLLLGTDGDYAFLFIGDGNIIQLNAAQGLDEASINSVVIMKQYYREHTYNLTGPVPLMWITTPNYVYISDENLQFRLRNDYSDWNGSTTLFRQNDRKAFSYSHFHGRSGLGGRCYGPDVSNFDLYVWHLAGSMLKDVPIDVYGYFADSMNAMYSTSRITGMHIGDDFGTYWAGKTGLNYLFNTSNCRTPSTPLEFFDGKQVNSISELHLFAALSSEYLTYILVGTTEGLYVSNESQKQHFSTRYSPTVLNGYSINDMESTSTGEPVEIHGVTIHHPAVFCEERLYTATTSGLFKLNYSIEPTSYEHVGDILYFNGVPLSSDEDTVSACEGADNILAIPFSKDANNFIQWQKDGVDIIGADTHFVRTNGPGVYRAVMWFECENIEAYSRDITIDFSEVPEFTFNPPEAIKLCPGADTVLRVQGKQEYQYQWFRNGEALYGETLQYLTVREAGEFYVGVRACGNQYTLSDTVSVIFHSFDTPQIALTDSTFCVGEAVTLRVTGTPKRVSLQWLRDGIVIPGEVADSLITTVGGVYSVTWDNGTCIQQSQPYILSFADLPIAFIKVTPQEALCHGESVTLNAGHAQGRPHTYRWSTGDTTQSIRISSAGMYTLEVSNAAGCTDTAQIKITMFDPLTLPTIPDTVICGAKNEVVRIQAPEGFAAYYWNGVLTQQSFYDITTPGSYTVKVNDENGCSAATTFQVREYCKDVIIPNAFSPNGDGINDTWIIGGLEDEPGLKLVIFNRSGQEIFYSKDYTSPWDGTYKGGAVPPGVYYYYIHTDTDAIYNGSLTILY